MVKLSWMSCDARNSDVASGGPGDILEITSRGDSTIIEVTLD